MSRAFSQARRHHAQYGLDLEEAYQLDLLHASLPLSAAANHPAVDRLAPRCPTPAVEPAAAEGRNAFPSVERLAWRTLLPRAARSGGRGARAAGGERRGAW